MSQTKVKIGIFGCGTVGSGLVKLIANYQEAKRQPELEIAKIFVRNDKRAQELASKLNLNPKLFTTDADSIVNDPEIEIVVELMGGVALAKDLIIKSLKQKKNIVTANKDLLATFGEELFELAKQEQRVILFEAAVAGGIPIISTLKQSLQANKIQELKGIINGTTNFILDVMKNEKQDFTQALKLAQEKGFAEADPTNDIDGHDAAYKIAILASIISNKRVDVKKVYREGIGKITQADIQAAAKRNYEIKLLGIINNTGDELDVRVHPLMINKNNPLASVHMENNAILIQGDAVKELMIMGRGAGSLPTASSVLADILMTASHSELTKLPNSQFVCKHTEYAKLKDFAEVENSFYIRVAMQNRVGVLKDLGQVTAHYKANVRFIDQYDADEFGAHADFIIDPIKEKTLSSMIEDIKRHEFIKEVESVIRVE